jgi:ADP-heptose:LPS heptosyltransferase/Flp pilus assembly protein TadD
MAEPPSSGAPADQERSRELTRQANALRAEGRWQEALPLSFEAVRADPRNAAAAHNLGVLLAKMGRLEEGEAATRHALSLAPNSPTIIHALAHALLAQGRYKEGWPLYEVRAFLPELNTGFPRDFPFPRWKGEPLAGKRLAIFPEQGLGDQIQFARFLPGLIEQAGAVSLLTMRQLERLFRHNFPRAEIVLADGAIEFPDPDYWITLHDLPAVLGIELETIPIEPYLRPPGTWPALPPGFRIGLKTKGNPKHINDKLRSLPEDCAERLRNGLPGTIVSLEPEDSGARDMADTAAIIDQLDLVVSVDTSVAHLAGALGKPCLLLIAGFSPDWRWMFGRDDSPWYPGHILFRSEMDGSWEGAVDRLIAEARARAATAEAPPGKESESLAGLMHRATALRDQAHFPEALDLMRQTVRKAPENPAALNILGTMLSEIGQLAEAEQFQRRALALAPDYPAFRNSLGTTLLAQGRYAEGWPLYQARSEVPSLSIGFPRGVAAPRWQGEDLAGKRLTILPEQGFGDEIQFVRFLPRLLATGARIRLFTRAALVDLFRTSFPEVEILAADGEVRLGEPDYWTTLVDMAQPLGVVLEDIPLPPYLRTDRTWPKPPGFTIGLQTSGNRLHTNDAWRSLSAEDAAVLRAGLPGRIVELDPKKSGARDFADTAALIEQLDLVVAVDTSVAHLAGALGKPCLLLVPSLATDWRWLRDRDDSSWYPGHRLYRSGADARWGEAIARLCEDARQLAGEAQAPVHAGRWSPTLESLRTTAGAQPRSVPAQRKLAELLIKVGDLREGEAVLRKAVALGGPETDAARYQLALCLLAQGRYREAWPLHRPRDGKAAALRPGYPQGINGPRWEGQPLAGKRLVVFAEQGLGDTLQLARFLPRLEARGAAVTLFERPVLVPFLQSALPSVRTLHAAELAAMGPQDYWTTTFDMLEWLEVDLAGLQPAAYGDFPTHPPQAEFRIGLCTRGNPTHPNDRWRSLPEDLAAQLREALPGGIVDLHPDQSKARDFSDTARIMADLDLVVSVDTAIGHLAGVMDKACLLLVPGFGTDWRWLRGRDDSPWYPRHRLFRSDVNGDWSQAIDDLMAEACRLRDGHG